MRIIQWILGIFYAGLSILVILIVTYFILGLIRRHTPAPISTVAAGIENLAQPK